MPEPMPLDQALRAVQAVAAQYREPPPDDTTDAEVLVAYLAAHEWHYAPIPCGIGWQSFEEWIRAYLLLYGGPLVADARYPQLVAAARAWQAAQGAGRP